MARRSLMQHLARWHIWLGWVVAIPLVLWTLSGLVMALRPIEQVRGEDLRGERHALSEEQRFKVPEVNGWPVIKMTLIQRVDGPVWIIERADHSLLTSKAQTGEQIQGVDAPLARRIADDALKSPARKALVRRFDADRSPIDLRRARPAWQVHYEDGTNVYVDADTGEVLALRTRWWRFYDFMWGLHIMDPVERENSSHPLLIGMAALGLLSTAMGSALLLRRRKAVR